MEVPGRGTARQLEEHETARAVDPELARGTAPCDLADSSADRLHVRGGRRFQYQEMLATKEDLAHIWPIAAKLQEIA